MSSDFTRILAPLCEMRLRRQIVRASIRHDKILDGDALPDERAARRAAMQRVARSFRENNR
jgi:hypothetical protein